MIRNSIGTLTEDALTQANPVAVATNVSTKLNVTKHGVLSGSVAFVRAASGNNTLGGPGTAAIQAVYAANVLLAATYRPLGVFINSAAGNAYENTPAVASGIGPYVSGQGTYGSSLYETDILANVAADGSGSTYTGGTDLVFSPGNELIASRNGLLMPKWQANNAAAMPAAGLDQPELTAEAFVRNARGASTIIGIVKMAPDAYQTEVVWDQRI